MYFFSFQLSLNNYNLKRNYIFNHLIRGLYDPTFIFFVNLMNMFSKFLAVFFFIYFLYNLANVCGIKLLKEVICIIIYFSWLTDHVVFLWWLILSTNWRLRSYLSIFCNINLFAIRFLLNFKNKLNNMISLLTVIYFFSFNKTENLMQVINNFLGEID